MKTIAHTMTTPLSATTEHINNSSSAPSTTQKDSAEPLLDPVTVLQDTIDSFSLSLFEALRTLRDTVAPDSSNQNRNNNNGNDNNNNNNPLSETDGDYEDFKASIQMKESHALQILGSRPVPQNREQYAEMLLDVERERDMELVSKLAEEVLEKSDKVDELVGNLPGMGRGKEEQMDRIGALLEENWKAVQDLEEEYQKAQQIREEVRDLLQKTTYKALGIEEEI